jgi:hypothetical protein
MMENEKKDAPNKMKYSIWDTRTEEKPAVSKEKLESLNLKSSKKS